MGLVLSSLTYSELANPHSHKPFQILPMSQGACPVRGFQLEPPRNYSKVTLSLPVGPPRFYQAYSSGWNRDFLVNETSICRPKGSTDSDLKSFPEGSCQARDCVLAFDSAFMLSIV